MGVLAYFPLLLPDLTKPLVRLSIRRFREKSVQRRSSYVRTDGRGEAARRAFAAFFGNPANVVWLRGNDPFTPATGVKNLMQGVVTLVVIA
jgi:hypothetical protein